MKQKIDEQTGLMVVYEIAKRDLEFEGNLLNMLVQLNKTKKENIEKLMK